METRKKILLSLTIGAFSGYLLGSIQKLNRVNEQANKWKREANKYEQSLLMTIKWLKVKINHGKLEDYFLKNSYNKIAIYGMNYVGVRLYEELSKSTVKVSYGIDRYTSSSEVDIPIYSLQDELDEVDVVVVTPVYFYKEIKQDLSEKLAAPVISMNDVLFEN